MKLGRYVVGGRVEIVDEAAPSCPPGGLLVRTEASGLCSGELMSWYLDRKAPHVLGHEVSGVVVESEDERFPVGCRVFPHHHAPCLKCEYCLRGAYVHCATWKATKLTPGGMAERFAVAAENLTDTLRVDDLRPRDAALIEPLACVVKSLRRVQYRSGEEARVVGLGVMGLLHMLLMPGAIGFDLNPDRVAWAKGLGLDARLAGEERGGASCVIVCPGSRLALSSGLAMTGPDARVCLFAPLPPEEAMSLDLEKEYFRDLTLTTAYSCGPDDTAEALRILQAGLVKAEQVVSNFIELAELPEAYQRMKRGEILKAMVEFR